MTTILDFQIRATTPERYQLEVFERGQSQPLTKAAFDYPLSFLTGFELNRLDSEGNDPVGRFERLQNFGLALYQKLFTTDILRLWQEYKDRSEFIVLCLRIAPEASGLEALPWEALFDGKEFLAAGSNTGLSRLPLDVPPQAELPPIPLPLKVFALVASPLDLKDEERLQIEREQEILLEAVNTPAGQGRLQVDFEDEAKLEILESSLESGYHLFHFTGHGIPLEKGGGLLLEDKSGKRHPTAVDEVLHCLQKRKNQLRLAVLSGCQTARTSHVAGFNDLARGLLRGEIPAVIAMQFSISDEGGLRFAEALYPKLVAGQPLELAVSATRHMLLESDDPSERLHADALAPVLLTTNGQCLQTTAVPNTVAQQRPIDFGFYGRRREYRQIRDGLLQRDHHAVVIHGIGGIGKTALANHVATRLKERFKGNYTFDCNTGELAPERIVLDLHDYLERQGVKDLERLKQLVYQSSPPEVLATWLAQILRQWPLLLIFDNFETLLERTDTGFRIQDESLQAFLRTLVKTIATRTRFLFTSRYLFDMDARHNTIQELPLSDLSRPEALSLMQKLPHLSEAVFEEKRKAFEIFGGHPYALVALDRHCNYRPLADVLRDAAALHTELREFLVLELSYARLSDRSRELLNRLAAFRGPVTLAAAEWVMGEKVAISPDKLQILEQRLSALDHSVLPEEWRGLEKEALLEKVMDFLPEQRQAQALDKPIAELIDWGLLMPGYKDGQLNSLAVHNLVRDFCCKQQRGETWRTRLLEAAAFYMDLTKLLSEDDKDLTAVMIEMMAFELLLEAEEVQEAAELLLGDHDLLIRWGFGRYVEGHYQRLLGRVEGRTSAVITHGLGVTQQEHGEYTAALDRYKQSLKIFKNLGDQANVARSLHRIGMIHHQRGEYTEALDKYEQSLKIKEGLGDQAGTATSLHQIGNIHKDRGEYAEALDKYERSLKIFEEAIGDQAGMAASLHQIGMIHHLRGEYAEALENYKRSLEIEKALDNQDGVARSLHQIGTIYHRRGEYAAALDKYEQSLKIKEGLGDQDGVAASLHQIGMIHQMCGDYVAALKTYGQSLEIYKALGEQDKVANAHSTIALLFIQTDLYAEAFEQLLLALGTFLKLQSPKAGITANMFKILRAQWGEKEFDAAWRKTTGEAVPFWLK